MSSSVEPRTGSTVVASVGEERAPPRIDDANSSSDPPYDVDVGAPALEQNFLYDFDDDEGFEIDDTSSQTYETLEGVVLQRRARVKASYRKRYLVLNLADGGSIACYTSPPPRDPFSSSADSVGSNGAGWSAGSKKKKGTGSVASSVRKKLKGSLARKFGKSSADASSKLTDVADDDTIPSLMRAVSDITEDESVSTFSGLEIDAKDHTRFRTEQVPHPGQPRWTIPASVDWQLRDVKNDDVMFQIMLPPGYAAVGDVGDLDDSATIEESPPVPEEVDTTNSLDEDNSAPSTLSVDEDAGAGSKRRKRPTFLPKRRVDEPRQTFHFKCQVIGNEKYLWLRAASRLHRLAKSHTICTCPIERARRKFMTSRTRTQVSAVLSETASRLDKISLDEEIPTHAEDFDDQDYNPMERMERLGVLDTKREHKVYPEYAYPHRWMTEKELYSEMAQPSHRFEVIPAVDGTEKNSVELGKVIGELCVEVLACLGLPKLNRFTNTNGVCYLVCGPYAFATDVIPQKLSPMWPSKSRRACIFPIHHAFARLFVGVFDNDGPKENDDFAGRVALDIARLRPGSTYDVTLPLRLYQNVYSTTRRGVIRLRFRLNLNSERAAVLSYLKAPLAAKKSGRFRPPAVTLNCADLKAFRNVALTVNGANLPGRYSQKIQRAAMREHKLYKLAIKALLKENIKGIISWKNPLLSCSIFLAWMHCVQSNSMSLVPQYAVACFIIVLGRNYARYGAPDSAAHGGFAPLSAEEILQVLIWGDGSMVPLEVGTRKGILSLRSGLSTSIASNIGASKGSTLADMDHTEFPFSEKEKYSKKRMHEAVLVPKKDAAKFEGCLSVAKSFIEEEDDEFDDEENTENAEQSLPSTFDMEKEGVSGQFSPPGSDLGLDDSSEKEDIAWKKTRIPLPQQDIDVRVPSRKKLKDEIADVKEKMYEMSLRLFDDRIYFTPDGDLHPDMQSPTNAEEEIAKELDKILGIHKHSNPLLAKMAPYLSPIIEMIKFSNFSVRAVFNLFMWRDPYLSFWALLGCIFLLMLLSVWPWRLFFFAAGFMLVGPQNWLMRGFKAKFKTGAKKPSADGEGGIKTEKEEASPKNKFDGTSSQDVTQRKSRFAKLRAGRHRAIVNQESNVENVGFVFHNHLATTDGRGRYSSEELASSSLRQVVIPYSPLLHSRFYDWPPEKAHARVRIASPE